MKKSRSHLLVLVLSILAMINVACNSEGQSSVTSEGTTPNITLADLLQELRDTCFTHNIESDQNPYDLEVAVQPGCEIVEGVFDYSGDVGKVQKRNIYIRYDGAFTKNGLRVVPVRFSCLESCGADERALDLSFNDDENVSIFEVQEGQTIGKVQPDQELIHLCVGHSKER